MDSFGTLAPCRTCHGTGEVRAKADPQLLRSRAHLRRKGIDVDDLPTMGPCDECGGRGVLPPAVADSEAPRKRAKVRDDQLGLDL